MQNTVLGVTTQERAVFYRERAANTYDVWSYAIPMGIVELPYIIICTAIFHVYVGVFYSEVRGKRGEITGCVGWNGDEHAYDSPHVSLFFPSFRIFYFLIGFEVEAGKFLFYYLVFGTYITYTTFFGTRRKEKHKTLNVLVNIGDASLTSVYFFSLFFLLSFFLSFLL